MFTPMSQFTKNIYWLQIHKKIIFVYIYTNWKDWWLFSKITFEIFTQYVNNIDMDLVYERFFNSNERYLEYKISKCPLPISTIKNIINKAIFFNDNKVVYYN